MTYFRGGEKKMISLGKLRGERTGKWCCIWYPMKLKGKSEEMGMFFDFKTSDLEDVIKLLEKMKARLKEEREG